MSKLDTSGGFGHGDISVWTETGGGFGADALADGTQPQERARKTRGHAAQLGDPADKRAGQHARAAEAGSSVRSEARSSKTESATDQ